MNTTMTMWCRALGLAAVLTTGLFLATTAAGCEMGPPEAYQDLGWEEDLELEVAALSAAADPVGAAGEAEVVPVEPDEELEACLCAAIAAYEASGMGCSDAATLAEDIQDCLTAAGKTKFDGKLECGDKTYKVEARTTGSTASSTSGSYDGVIAVGGDAVTPGNGDGGNASATNSQAGGFAVAVGGDGGDPQINARAGGDGGNALAKTTNPKGGAQASGGDGSNGNHGTGACAVADSGGSSSVHGQSVPNQ